MSDPHQQADITATELVATIERSRLLTVLVEGRDDMAIYDSLYAWNGQVSIVQTQGRCTLLETFVAAKEKGLLDRCVFVADRDLYVFEGIPAEYEEIIFTTGYSIENDVVAGCRMIKNLLRDAGVHAFESGKHFLSKWFAFYVEQHIARKNARADIKPLALLETTDSGEFIARPGALEKMGFQNPAEELVVDIETNFEIKFRGKNLVDYISASFYNAHKVNERIEEYNHNQIIDIALNAETRSTNCDKIKDRIKNKLLAMKTDACSNSKGTC